jgi:formamidopyrimidine-DNA glycosylase
LPELPEVETTRRGLAPHLVGHKILRADIHEPRLRWRVPDSLAGELHDQHIHAIERRAKYLLLTLDRGTLIWHLGMSGSLRVLAQNTPRLKHDHIDLRLDSDLLLRFNDPRRFGCCIYTTAPPALHPLLRRLAPEPFDPRFDAAYMQRVTRRRRVAIKQLLLNGTLVTGVGNIYASEALFRARIRPGRAAQRLTHAECARLVRAIRAVLRSAIRAGGTTLRDYVNAEGGPGYFRQKLYVYERAGLPCRVCRTPIRQFAQGQRSTYYCSLCQQ